MCSVFRKTSATEGDSHDPYDFSDTEEETPDGKFSFGCRMRHSYLSGKKIYLLGVDLLKEILLVVVKGLKFPLSGEVL